MAEQNVELAASRKEMWLFYGDAAHKEHWDRLVDALILAAKAEAIRDLLTGEPKGPWKVVPGKTNVRWWACINTTGGICRVIDGFTCDAEARAVANVLNALAALTWEGTA